MKTIVHITCDFPDPMVSAKTFSVRNLLKNSPDFRHVVYSLNRANWKSGIFSLRFDQDCTALAYGAPPNGLYHVKRLEEVADWIANDLRGNAIAMDGFHAHKLSVEGIIAQKLSQEFNRPFICDIWGDTDLKITSVRRDLTPKWKTMLRDAAAIIPCAPWASDQFEEKFRLDRAKATVLPPIIQHDHFLESAPSDKPRLVTLFNLNVHRRKNFSGLVRAVREVAQSGPDLTLDVYGAGLPETWIEISAEVREAGLEDRVNFMGRLPDDGFSHIMNSYTAFVMPTLRETFGMVFIEAIFAGLPILHTRRWGVDGFFADDLVGYAWNGTDQADIARGLEYLIHNEAKLKKSIAQLHATGQLDMFKRDHIVATYRDIVTKAFPAALAS